MINIILTDSLDSAFGENDRDGYYDLLDEVYFEGLDCGEVSVLFGVNNEHVMCLLVKETWNRGMNAYPKPHLILMRTVEVAVPDEVQTRK